MIRDIHTHRLPMYPEEAIVSYYYSSPSLAGLNKAVHLSAGIHPWFLSEEDITSQLTWLDTLLEDKRIRAIGEAGLDKCCHTPFNLQQKAFEAQITRSESLCLPMILHIVRSYQELISCRKNFHAHQPWIIHGFRGKKEVAQTLLNQGFYLSFGQKFHPETLRYVPDERLLLETDESSEPIQELYQKVAFIRETTVNHLEDAVSATINQLFFSR